MPRQRILLLALCLLLFLVLSALYGYRQLVFKRNNYRIGQVPQEIVNQLLPKKIPVESIRPPALRLIDPVRYGSVTSVVSVIEFGDFQCDYCRKAHLEIEKAALQYKGRVRFVWRDLPSKDHKYAMEAAVLGRCAHLQGKFWSVYDLLMKAETLNDRLLRQAAALPGLDENKIAACRQDKAVENSIKKDMEAALADGIQSVPFIFVGTKQFDHLVDAEALRQAIDQSLSSL